jgi:hypothetical protein
MKTPKAILMFLFFCSVLAMTKPCSAAEETDRKWSSYAKDRNGVEYFYEKDTIERPTDNLLKMWRRRSFPLKAAQQEIVSLDEFDCVKQRFRTVEVRVKYKDNKWESFKKLSQWAVVYADTADAYFIETYCK